MAGGDEPMNDRRRLNPPRKGEGGLGRDRRILAGIAALAAIVILIGGAFAGLLVEGVRDLGGAIGAFDPYLAESSGSPSGRRRCRCCWPSFPRFRSRAPCRAIRIFPAAPLSCACSPCRWHCLRSSRRLASSALLGHAGYLATPLGALAGGAWPGIYGLSGILVAHIFFNLPLATRFFLEALDTLPADQWRLASQLGMGPAASFRLIEWPAMRGALPGVAGLVFMLCVTSFTIVLTLGGGPAATTLEVAIYQALRFDFDPARAVTFTLLQIALTAVVMVLLTRLGANAAIDASLPVAPRKFVTIRPAEAVFNTVSIVLALIFVAGPIAATVAAGLAADLAQACR